ncbi:MAG: ferrous iron transport protein A [Clostridia bacterium]|nr:ferrous iron transport protein A [Clostridia bacterium]
MALSEAKVGRQMEIQQVTGTEKVQKFLFSLGCHAGERITLISILAGNYIISVKDSRYAIDRKMAQAIQLIG